MLPLTQSHPPSWFALSVLGVENRQHAKISYRLGTRAMWQDNHGYDNVSWIEYLGFDYEPIERGDDIWNLPILKAYSLDSILAYEHRLSWQFETGLSNQCAFCNTSLNHFYISGGGGIALPINKLQIFLLAHLKSESWLDTGPEAVLAPGYRAGLQWRSARANLLALHEQHWWKAHRRHESSVRGTFYVSSRNEIFTEFKHLYTQFDRQENHSELGWVHFF